MAVAGAAGPGAVGGSRVSQRAGGVPPPRWYVRSTISMRGSYSRHVSNLQDTEEFGESEPWMSPGATAQRPPRLLLPLLGDYGWQRPEPLPSAAIVALLADFGVGDSAARAALSRLTRNGLLVTSKIGRRAFSPPR